MSDSKWVRLTGLWKHKTNPKMLTGTIQGENFDKLIAEAIRAQELGTSKLQVTLWLNEQKTPRDAKATLTCIASDSQGQGGGAAPAAKPAPQEASGW